MEAIKTKRGRVAAGKHRTRPVEVRYRSESRTMLADGWPRRWPRSPKEWLLTALMALTMTGILPMLAASFLIWLTDPIPSWLFLAGLFAALIGAVIWLWRAL